MAYAVHTADCDGTRNCDGGHTVSINGGWYILCDDIAHIKLACAVYCLFIAVAVKSSINSHGNKSHARLDGFFGYAAGL